MKLESSIDLKEISRVMGFNILKPQILDSKKSEKFLENGIKIFDINYNDYFESKFNEIINLIKKVHQI